MSKTRLKRLLSALLFLYFIWKTIPMPRTTKQPTDKRQTLPLTFGGIKIRFGKRSKADPKKKPFLSASNQSLSPLQVVRSLRQKFALQNRSELTQWLNYDRMRDIPFLNLNMYNVNPSFLEQNWKYLQLSNTALEQKEQAVEDEKQHSSEEDESELNEQERDELERLRWENGQLSLDLAECESERDSLIVRNERLSRWRGNDRKVMKRQATLIKRFGISNKVIPPFSKQTSRTQKRNSAMVNAVLAHRSGGEVNAFVLFKVNQEREVKEEFIENCRPQFEREFARAAKATEWDPVYAERMWAASCFTMTSNAKQRILRTASRINPDGSPRTILNTSVPVPNSTPSEYKQNLGRDAFFVRMQGLDLIEVLCPKARIPGFRRQNILKFLTDMFGLIINSTTFDEELKPGIPNKSIIDARLESDASFETRINDLVFRIGWDKFPWERMQANAGTEINIRADIYKARVANTLPAQWLYSLLPVGDTDDVVGDTIDELYAKIHNKNFMLTSRGGRVKVKIYKARIEPIVDGLAEPLVTGTGGPSSTRPIPYILILRADGTSFFPERKVMIQYLELPHLSCKDDRSADDFMADENDTPVARIWCSDVRAAQEWKKNEQSFKKESRGKNLTKRQARKLRLKIAIDNENAFVSKPKPGVFVYLNSDGERKISTSTQLLHLQLRTNSDVSGGCLGCDIRDKFESDMSSDDRETFWIWMNEETPNARFRNMLSEQWQKQWVKDGPKIVNSFPNGIGRQVAMELPEIILELALRVKSDASLFYLAFDLFLALSTPKFFFNVGGLKYDGLEDPRITEAETIMGKQLTIFRLFRKERSSQYSRLKAYFVTIPMLKEAVPWGLIPADEQGQEHAQNATKSGMRNGSCPSNENQIRGVMRLSDGKRAAGLEQGFYKFTDSSRRKSTHSVPSWTQQWETKWKQQLRKRTGKRFPSQFLKFFRGLKSVSVGQTKIPKDLKTIYVSLHEEALCELDDEEREELCRKLDISEAVLEIYDEGCDEEIVSSVFSGQNLSVSKENGKSNRNKRNSSSTKKNRQSSKRRRTVAIANKNFRG